MVVQQQQEPQVQVMLKLDVITERLPVRRLSPSGVARLKESIQRSGFLENFPLVVTPYDEVTFRLIDGNHRFEAALALGIELVPCVVKPHLSEQERYMLAWRSNNAAETVVPSTLVTYAEFVWARSPCSTQAEIALMLGWSRDKVAKYAALNGISQPAWNVIVTTFERAASQPGDGVVTSDVTGVTFTENLLRDLLPLAPDQQLELVQSLSCGAIKKARFTELARAYRCRNEMYIYAQEWLGDLGEEYRTKLHEEVYSGAYDADWKTAEHAKLQRMLTALREEWERKHSMHLLHGDFFVEVKKIGDGCIDLILTDPPYNISCENEFELEGRSNLSQDFGAWDKQSEEEFLASFEIWAREWARLLRHQGSGYVFTSDRYLSHLRTALVAAGLHVKATIVWHKTNPGTQVVKTNFKSSVEYVLFFTKGEGGHTFNWQGESAMHNFIEAPICGGKERLVDAKGHTLHPTQKPEQVLRHFLDISSNRGDTVFDGFAGVGSTGKVAKDRGRKFIGIEQDKRYFDAMVRRLAE
jgi:site-specific DNA-methyltransferase (adenine-specific)